ncbi:MAG TPA: DUF2272 domain-containing protein [Allosphingosinicella sp.]|nr:DUF2272 domain-containing protein [Allosphingosinicella sp.]
MADFARTPEGPLDALGLEVPFSSELESGEEEQFTSGFAALDETPFAGEGEFTLGEQEELEPFATSDSTRIAAESSGEMGEVLTLRRGSSGTAVAKLQLSLGRLGFRISADGKFGPNTERAVLEIQRRAGVAADGVVDARTFSAIDAAVASRGAPAGRQAASASPNISSGTGRLIVDRHPLLASHRGTHPDLILKWSGLDSTAGEVDIVVHFHGYSGHLGAMRLDRHKEAISGLDFADPAGSSTPRRERPTIAILPRGNFAGQPRAGRQDRYDFPALVGPGALRALIDDSLGRVGTATGRQLSPGRLILTAHSGGGAPVMAILGHMDPDEVQILDGMYQPGTNLIRWAQRRVAAEIASPAAIPPAARIVFNPASGTRKHSEQAARDLCRILADAGAVRLQSRFRVDRTAVAHNDIPRRFGWLLLADAGADLPGAKTLACPAAATGEAEWENEAMGPASLREESQMESALTGEERHEEGFEPQAEWQSQEDLAWLDYEGAAVLAEEMDMPAAERESPAGEEPEALWPEAHLSGDEAFDESAYEQASLSEAFDAGNAEGAGSAQFEEEETEEEAEESESARAGRFDELEDERDAEWEASEATLEMEEETGLAGSGFTPAEQKAVEITSTFETGKRGGFFGLTGNFDGQGLSFGLVNWTIGTGSLQPLLRVFASSHKDRWNAIFGADAARFLAILSIKAKDAVKQQHRFAVEEMNRTWVEKGKRKWAVREPWAGYFLRLSEDTEFRKIQIRYVRDLLSRGEYFCRYFKLTSEAAFAFMFDAVSSHGKWWLTKKFAGQEKRRLLLEARLAALASTYGAGKVPEGDVLLEIADVLAATSAPRWAHNVRQRKRWFVTGEHPRAKELHGLTPRLDLPYSSAAGTGGTPNPVPGSGAPPPAPAPIAPGAAPPPPPVPATSANELGAAIARVAEEEYRRWHPKSGPIRETDAVAVPILQRYYREALGRNVTPAQLQDPAWQKAHPWSAVFVSWVMRTAGAGDRFAYSAAHQTYIARARQNRLLQRTDTPFWAYRATEVAPQVGDVICKIRENSGATYDNIGDGQSRSTHGDIVTEVHPGWLRVIGGNVNQNVDTRPQPIRTLPDGRLALDGKQSVYFAVVRCRGAAPGLAPAPGPKPAAQPPGPAQAGSPAAPGTPAPVPGKALSAKDFVAAYGPAAKSSAASSGVPALVTLGQAALESGWGKSAPRFNFFGIKAKASDPEASRQLLRTREVLAHANRKFPEIISITKRPDGKYDYVVRDWFRAYPDATAGFLAHGEFLARNKRYAKAFAVADDPYAFATEVAKAGYATAPNYAQALTAVMRKIEAAGGR